jgi:hypothetical protein
MPNSDRGRRNLLAILNGWPPGPQAPNQSPYRGTFRGPFAPRALKSALLNRSMGCPRDTASAPKSDAACDSQSVRPTGDLCERETQQLDSTVAEGGRRRKWQRAARPGVLLKAVRAAFLFFFLAAVAPIRRAAFQSTVRRMHGGGTRGRLSRRRARRPPVENFREGACKPGTRAVRAPPRWLGVIGWLRGGCNLALPVGRMSWASGSSPRVFRECRTK